VFERESAPLERLGQEWIRTTEGVKPADLQKAGKLALVKEPRAIPLESVKKVS
jgi:hypothetical protein